MRQILTLTKQSCYKVRARNRILISGSSLPLETYFWYRLSPVQSSLLWRLGDVWEGGAVVSTEIELENRNTSSLLTIIIPQVAAISFLSETPTIESPRLERIVLKCSERTFQIHSHHHRISRSPGLFWSRECHHWQWPSGPGRRPCRSSPAEAWSTGSQCSQYGRWKEILNLSLLGILRYRSMCWRENFDNGKLLQFNS